MVLLNCAVVGDRILISVEIAEGKTVDLVKDVIKDKKMYPFPSGELQLFVAKTEDGAWLDSDSEDIMKLTRGEKTDLIEALLDKQKELQGASGLQKKVLKGMPQPSPDEIHLLVMLPDNLSTLVGSQTNQIVVDAVTIPVTTSMMLNPPALVAFWKALKTLPTEMEAGEVIALPEGVFLLGDPTLGSAIYIRMCYPQLWSFCWETIHDEVNKTPHLVILGNPGIGKTFFGFVILMLLARAGATAIYESGGSKKRFLFAHDVVVQGSQQDFVGILDRPTTFYIVDAVKPAYYPAKTIPLTSPRRGVWYHFNKTHCLPCYMPIWSLKEILQCHQLMYSDTPAAVVLDCFRRWGGIARYVLGFAQVSKQQVLLENAIDSVDLNGLVNVCGKLDAIDDQVSHRLLHFRVDKHFNNEHFVFASQYVQLEVYKHLYMQDKQKLVDFISASDGIGALAVLRGHLFEGYVHSVLPRGGTFRVRRLVDNDEAHGDDVITEGDWNEDEGEDDSMDEEYDDDVAMEDSTTATWDLDDAVVSVQLPERRTVVFNSNDEITAADTTVYLRPVVKNYKSVDAISKPDVLFQITGARKHPCKQSGLYDVLKLLGNPSAPRLYFVLPPDRFNTFRYQRYVNAKGKMVAIPWFKNVRRIQQFAMEVSLVAE